MHKYSYKWLLISLTILCVSSSQAATGGWKFSWSDEFNGPSVDSSVWGFEKGYVRNNEDQYYTDRTQNSRIDSGTLLIQAIKEKFSGYDYTSASRRSMGKKSWLYGRFEMRAKIDIRQGSWPAWWWLPNSGGWPKGGEIDMMEFYKGNCLFNVMDGSQKWSSKTKSTSSLGGAAWAAQFHVWTWEWDSAKIDISLDGTLMNHYSVANADGTGPSGANPFRKPGYMLVNQAIGGNNGGDPSGTTFPVEYRIDWIRVHTWTDSSAYTLTVKNGVGSGPYIAGTLASITATAPPSGKMFDKWTAASGSPAIDKPTSPTARLTMPAADVEVTATYKTSSLILHPFSSAMRLSFGNEPSAIYTVSGRKIAQSINDRFAKSGLPSGIYIKTRYNQSVQLIVVDP
jgi:beta-glucanase (GH16 family)